FCSSFLRYAFKLGVPHRPQSSSASRVFSRSQASISSTDHGAKRRAGMISNEKPPRYLTQGALNGEGGVEGYRGVAVRHQQRGAPQFVPSRLLAAALSCRLLSESISRRQERSTGSLG